jgi:hypothetical protein
MGDAEEGDEDTEQENEQLHRLRQKALSVLTSVQVFASLSFCTPASRAYCVSSHPLQSGVSNMRIDLTSGCTLESALQIAKARSPPFRSMAVSAN